MCQDVRLKDNPQQEKKVFVISNTDEGGEGERTTAADSQESQLDQLTEEVSLSSWSHGHKSYVNPSVFVSWS